MVSNKMVLGEKVKGMVWVKLQSFHWGDLNEMKAEKMTGDLSNIVESNLWDKVNESVLEVRLEVEYSTRRSWK